MEKKKILIVDDEETVLITMADRFRLEGYDVITAQNGNEGIRKAKSKSYYIIVLDIMLPDMSGHEMCRTLKSIEGITAPIVMATSKIDAVDSLRAEQSGARDFAVKTANYDHLIESVKRIIG